MYRSPKYGSLLQKPPLGATLLRGHSIAQGLVFAMIFNDSGQNKPGEYVKYYGDTAFGTLGTQPSWSADGPSINFPVVTGSTNKVDCGSTGNFANGAGDMTCLAFCKASGASTGAQGRQEIVAFGNPTDGGLRGWQLCSGQTGRAGQGFMEFQDGTNDLAVSAAGPNVWDGLWHSVAGTKRPSGSGGLHYFVDGVDVGGALATYSLNNYGQAGDNLAIGYRRASASDYNYQGQIALVYIWFRALTQQEIAWVHAQPYDIFGMSKQRARVYGMVPVAQTCLAKPLRNVPLTTIPRYAY